MTDPATLLRRSPLARIIAILLAAPVALWLTFAATFAQAVGDRQPAAALSWRHANAAAQAESAWQMLASRRAPTRGQIARAKALAESALRREPGNVTAVRTLGLIAAGGGDQPRAQRLFRYSESLSRRDLPTQLWLIESEVAENDIEGALRHYDRALRTSMTARDLLIPILIQASADPAVARPLGARMAARPEWWTIAIGPIIRYTPNPVSLLPMIDAMRLDLDERLDRGVLVAAQQRLVEAGEYAAASRLHARATGGAGRGVTNGDFNDDRGLPPFDWVLIDDVGLGARVQPGAGPGNNGALFLIAEQGRGGQVASQLLTLRPGRYRLRAHVGQVEGDLMSRPLLSLVCARPVVPRGGAPTRIGELRFPLARASGVQVELRFEIPGRGCAAQWLALNVSSGVDAAAAMPWIDAIRIQGP